MGRLLLGLDVGTSGVKAGVFDLEGRLRGLGRSSHENDTPQPGWVQCDPETWWAGCLDALGQACAEAGAATADISAVGVSTQFPVLVAMDEAGRAVHPAILYCDRRSIRQMEAIDRAVPRDEFERFYGNVLTPGTCAVTSLVWLRDEEPKAYGKAHCFGFANTFVTRRLTGRFAADPSMASLSGMVEVNDPWQWAGEFCDRLGVDASRLPAIVGADRIVGGVSEAAAAQTGLAAGTPVVCGCGDVVASAVGVGAVDASTLVCVAGSTDCFAMPMSAPTEDRRWLNTAYVPRGAWIAIGTMTSTGVSVEWFTRELLAGGGAERMTELAADSAPGAGGVIYLPYLQGERSPIWDASARGMFFGLSTETALGDLARSVFEGTAFGLRQVLESLEEMIGRQVGEIRLVGGATRNAFWNQVKSDVLQKPLAILEFQETSSLGAALLAGVGAGFYDSFEAAAAVARSSCRVEVVEPNARMAQDYGRLYDVYCRLYPATRDLAHRMAGEQV